MKNSKSKKGLKSFFVSKKGRFSIAAFLILGVFPATSWAANIDLPQILGGFSLDNFNTGLTNLAGIVTQEFTKITAVPAVSGDKNNAAPQDTAIQVKNSTDLFDPNTLALTPSQQQVGAHSSFAAAEKVYSVEAQKRDKEREDEVEELDRGSLSTVNDTINVGDQSRGLESSQEILKNISYQLASQAIISDVQVRLSAIQGSQVQQLAEQAASSNLAISANMTSAMGKNQADKLTKYGGGGNSEKFTNHYTIGVE
jgi:hypothetical protein